MTNNLTFENDGDWAPVLSIAGTISASLFTVYTPELDGALSFQGDLSAIIPQPQPLAPLAGEITFQGEMHGIVNVPHAAFADFAHYPYGGVDPALAMAGATSGSLTSAAAGSYNRQYAVITAPQDYPVSGGGYAWKKAAYASVGFKFASMNANSSQLLDAVQLETAPVGATVPSPYSLARQIQVTVKPTRLNYATNPNMESGITGYSEWSGATVAADSFAWQGTQSLKTTVPATVTQDAGATFTVSGLIPGNTYTMSARISIAVGCGDVYALSGDSTSTQIAQTSYRLAQPDPTNARWRVVTVTFQAIAPTVNLGWNVLKTTMSAGTPSIFWTDGVLIEAGSSARPYFDGGMGEDYLWESGGSDNQSRSYYYENRVERSYLVQTLLDENTPLGITSAVPLYAVLPTQ